MDYSVFNQMKIPVCVMNSEGTLIFKNNLFVETIIGGSDTNYLALDTEHTFYTEYRKRFAVSFQKALSGHEAKCYAVLKSSSGLQLPVEIHLYPMIYNYSTPGILAFFKLADPKRIDSFLAFDESASSISDNNTLDNVNFFEFSPFPVLRVNSELNIIAASNSIEELTGKTRNDLFKDRELIFKLFMSYDLEKFRTASHEVISGNMSFKRINDVKIVNHKQIEKYVNIVFYQLLQDKKIIGGDIIFEDITRQKYLEKKLSLLNKANILRNITKGLLHSLNNTINIVVNKSQLLLQLSDKKNVLDGLKVINLSSSDAAVRIKRIQEFLTDNGDSSDSEIVNIIDLIRDSIEFANINFRVEKKENKRDIRITKQYFTKFMVQGNIKLIKEIIVSIIFKVASKLGKKGIIEISLKEKGDMVLSVSIRKEYLFSEPIDPMANYLPEIEIRRIAEKINIRIFEEESPEIFSVIAIIPAKMIYHDTALVEELTDIKIRDKEILIVEDETAISDILFELFNNMGNKVTVLTNTTLGVSEIKTNHYDIVISDYGFEDMSGIEFLTVVKEINHKTITVLSTGWTFNKNLKNTKVVDLFLQKPFQIEFLIKELSKKIKN